MILSAGLTPAWQHVLVFDRFRPGEVNRAREAHWCASGKVLNAAVAAHRLGGPVLALAAAGGPPLPQMDRDLAELGVPHRWISTAAATQRVPGRRTPKMSPGRLRPPSPISLLQPPSRAGLTIGHALRQDGPDPHASRGPALTPGT
jgi:hypothetical protein